MSKEISVIVRVKPSNEDVDVNLPLNATASDVIETLLDNGIGSKKDDEGNDMTYQLVPKGKNTPIEEDETLSKAQIQDGDVLLMLPMFVAG